VQLTSTVTCEASIGAALAATACTLLSFPAEAQVASYLEKSVDIAKDWNLDSALAYYHENGRIQAVEPVVSLSKTFSNESTLSLDGVFDTLSGSTPNGALTSNRPQTFTSPSGKSFASRHTYITPAGQLPVDSSYSDQRVALSTSWEYPLMRALRTTLGGKFSYEDDFDSLTASAGVAYDVNDKNTTFAVSVFDEFDWISPIGGAPVARSDYALFDKTAGNVSKNGAGVVLGVTQIITRRWISELNLAVDRFKGYLNDPYKILSVLGADGNGSGYEYESRPDQRLRKSVYLENRVAGELWSGALSLRYMADDWQVRSTTATLNAHLWFANHERYFEPSVRWYHQSAASFYTPYITDSTAAGAPEFASSDTRLSRFHALTYGIKYAQQFFGRPDRAASELSVRLEYYRQTIENRFATPVSLEGLNLYPDLDALFLQVGWRF
jgi:Protein of unknown function (DUF3570)